MSVLRASSRIRECALLSPCNFAGIAPVTLHGLRRSFSSLAEWTEVPPGIKAQIEGHKPSSIAERLRPLDLLRMWHDKLEAWLLNEAGINFKPEQNQQGLQAVEWPYNVSTSMYINEADMNLLIAKWGNSLALRLPADYVRRIGVKEGDQVEASLTIDGGICLRAARWDRQAFSRELEKCRADMPMTESVMDELRREARY